MKKGIIFFLFGICVALLAFVALKTRQQPKPFEVNTDRAAVIKEMRELNRLETATFTIEKIIDAGTQGNKLKTFLFGDRLLLIAHGKVIAGFDLSTLRESDIVVKDESLTIRLPAPQILISTIDNSQTRVYDRRQGILTLGEKDLESEARQAAEQSIRQAACTGGILEEAAQNGRRQLTAFFGALGFTEINLTIPPGKC